LIITGLDRTRPDNRAGSDSPTRLDRGRFFEIAIQRMISKKVKSGHLNLVGTEKYQI